MIAASAGAGAATPLVSGTVRALWSRVDPLVRRLVAKGLRPGDQSSWF